MLWPQLKQIVVFLEKEKKLSFEAFTEKLKVKKLEMLRIQLLKVLMNSDKFVVTKKNSADVLEWLNDLINSFVNAEEMD